jgi:hypothetical protein
MNFIQKVQAEDSVLSCMTSPCLNRAQTTLEPGGEWRITLRDKSLARTGRCFCSPKWAVRPCFAGNRAQITLA